MDRSLIVFFVVFLLFSCCKQEGVHKFGKFSYTYLYTIIENNYTGHFVYLYNFNPKDSIDLIEIQNLSYCYLNNLTSLSKPFGQLYFTSIDDPDIEGGADRNCLVSVIFDDSLQIISIDSRYYKHLKGKGNLSLLPKSLVKCR